MCGIYIHIPFCVQKCKYCDFASYPSELSRQSDYIKALIDEMKQYKGTKADTIYIGGGTPTCLDANLLEQLLVAVNSLFQKADNTEFTVEANPGTLSDEKAGILKKHGVNRISIGAQSFDNKLLKILGRIHTAEETIEIYELLRKNNFENLSLDLMYALPEQTIENLSTSIDQVLSLSPEHISCYGLKYEKGTPFFQYLDNGIFKETDDDTFADMYELICCRLKEAGYVHYEISNFSKPGKESRHNLKYWDCKDYLGFGVAAASCVNRRRFTHSQKLDDYFNGYILSEDYTVSEAELMSEFIVLGLRVLNKGVDKIEFNNRFSVNFDDLYKNQLSKFSKYLINEKNTIKLAENAVLVSNSILCEFMN